MRQPALADTLDRLADAGADDLYRGRLAAAVVAFCDEDGAALTARDLADVPRGPAAARRGAFRGAPDPHQRAAVVGRPAAGATGSALHDRLPPADDPLGARRCARSPRSCARRRRRRGPALARDAARSGARAAARGPVGGARPRRGCSRAAGGPRAGRRSAAPRGTSHVSVVDARRQRRRDDELDRLRLGRVRRRRPGCTSTTCSARRT